jgi:hypothetical protein
MVMCILCQLTKLEHNHHPANEFCTPKKMATKQKWGFKSVIKLGDRQKQPIFPSFDDSQQKS